MRPASTVVLRFLPRRATRRSAEAFSQFIFLVPFSITAAAWNSAVRSATSPVVISPDTSRSTDRLRFRQSHVQPLRKRRQELARRREAQAADAAVPFLTLARLAGKRGSRQVSDLAGRV